MSLVGLSNGQPGQPFPTAKWQWQKSIKYNKEFINGLIEKYKDKINERINKINKKGCKINDKFEILLNDTCVKEIRKLNKIEIDEMVYEVSKVVQIAEYLYRKPCELSGGQQQRVAIAESRYAD